MIKVDEAAERRLSSCPFTDTTRTLDGFWTDAEWIRVRYLHYIYVRSDEAVLNGVRCGCRP